MVDNPKNVQEKDWHSGIGKISKLRYVEAGLYME
jgi:hypothetical protein